MLICQLLIICVYIYIKKNKINRETEFYSTLKCISKNPIIEMRINNCLILDISCKDVPNAF